MLHCPKLKISFHIYWTWDKRNLKEMLGASKNCGWWSDIEAVTLAETILEKVILE